VNNAVNDSRVNNAVNNATDQTLCPDELERGRRKKRK
jgi:hypothetical protein